MARSTDELGLIVNLNSDPASVDMVDATGES